MEKKEKKTLLYNLIFFDFILLETSTLRISNFFIEKVKKKKLSLLRLSLFEMLKAFKQFLKLFKFIKQKKKINQNIIYCWVNSEYIIDFFNIFFKKYKLSCFFKFNTFFPTIPRTCKPILSSAILFDQFLSKKKFFSFYFKKLWLIQTINICDTRDFFTYKIFSNLNDYKKLIFFGLLLNSIFKK